MQKNDYSLSSEAILGESSHDEEQTGSVSVISSESHKDRENPAFRMSSDLQNVIFVKLLEVSKQNLEAGYIDQALHGFERCTEQQLTILRGDTNSKIFQDYLHNTLSYLNDIALKHLRANDLENSIKILNKCLEISHPEPYKAHPDVQSLTFNHLGCCYRRMGDLDQALYCLQKALHYHEKALEKFEAGAQYLESSSITHVNLCAVLSQKGKKALEHAKKAVADCTREFIHAKQRRDSSKPDSSRKKATMLAIAYYNLGVEEDFCQEPDAALESYKKAYQLAEEYNGAGDPVTLRFHQTYQEAKSKKRSNSPLRVPSVRLNSPLRSPKTVRTSNIRPQSAQNIATRDSSKPKVERFASPRTKLSIVTGSNIIDSEASTPHNRVRSAILGKSSTAPSFLNKVFPGTTRPKKTPRLPVANTRLFFFPMGNRAPLVEPEETKKVPTKPKPQKPKRPFTANPSSGTVQDHRLNRPLSPKVEFGDAQNRRFFARSDFSVQQVDKTEYQEEHQKPTIIINKAEDFAHSSHRTQPYSPKYFEGNNKLSTRGNESTKRTTLSGEPADEAGFSFRRKETFPEANKVPRRKINYKSPLYNCAALIIQKEWRGWKTRKIIIERGGIITGAKYWTGLVRTLKKDFEDNGRIGEYIVVMIYYKEEEMVYVEMKDLEKRIVYKGRVEFPLDQKELKQICESLLDSIGIEEGRIVFKQKPIEDIKEDLMGEISERSEESDVGPLIEALEKETAEFMNEDTRPYEELEKIEESDFKIEEKIEAKSEEKSERKIEDKPEQEIMDIKLERLETYETQEESQRENDRSSKNGSITGNKMSERDRQSREGKNSHKELGYQSKRSKESRGSKISKDSKGSKGSKVVVSSSDIEDTSIHGSKVLFFSKKAIVKGQVISFKLESQNIIKGKPRIFLTCVNLTSASKPETVELPNTVAEKKDLTVGDLLDHINIEFDPFRVNLHVWNEEPKNPHDSFSSHGNASIAYDITNNNNEREMSALFKSESLRKQSSIEERQNNKLLRGLSSSILDNNTPRAEKELPQFLGMGLRMQRPLITDETRCFTLGIRVPEVSSGREQSNQDLQGWRVKKDSRTTMSQGNITERSEAEGSIMLRVAEGVTLYCRVAYKKGESEVLVKYSTNGEQLEDLHELKLSLEELGLENGDLEKDLLFEKVRSLLGKRMKYRNGSLVYTKKKNVSRESTLKEDDAKEASMGTSREEEKKQESLRMGINLEKIDEEIENDRKVTKGLGGSALIGRNKEETPRKVEEKRRNTEGLKILLTKASEDVDLHAHHQFTPKQEVKEESKISRGVTFGKNPENETQDFTKPVTNRSRSAEINYDEGDRTLIETFGALHSTETTTEVEKPLNWMDSRHRVGSIDENMQLSKQKTPSVEEQLDKKAKSRLKVVSSPDTLSPKRNYSKPSSLKPPEYRKEDSSPKVKSNFYKNKGSEGSVAWGTLVNQQLSEERKISEGSSKAYLGDIPKIVIHGEKGGSKVLDFKVLPKAMSLGILDGDLMSSPLNDKNASRGFSMALTDIDKFDANDEWAKFKASQKKEKERLAKEKKDANTSKDSNNSEARNGKDYEKDVKESRSSLVLMESK